MYFLFKGMICRLISVGVDVYEMQIRRGILWITAYDGPFPVRLTSSEISGLRRRGVLAEVRRHNA